MLHYLPKCASTQDEIPNFLSEENPAGCGVYTFNQTKGRGQYGNTWIAPENLNIAYSLATKTSFFKISDAIFNFHTALILRNFLSDLTAKTVKIKWPNDIIISNKKISGILTEKIKQNGEFFFIIGIGLNVLQENFEHLTKAGSLLTQTSKTFDLKEIATRLHQFFSKNLSAEKSAPTILEEYNFHLFKRNEIGVFETDHLKQNGIIKHCDEAGFLWIELENNGLRKFYHKEINMFF
jgi:BirA family biotin operon repressor/biotin-[acetyl-CoA-carboxylase] ligase